MFDVGFSELILLAVVALVVLGPEKLPHAARILGAWVGRIRRTVSQMQAEIEREVSAQEMKARMEKALDPVSGKKFLEELQAEQQKMDAELRELSRAATSSLSTSPDVTAAPTAPSEPTPVTDTLPSALLAEASQSPDKVVLDGEAAYREWLASQRIPAPKAPDSAETPPS